MANNETQPDEIAAHLVQAAVSLTNAWVGQPAEKVHSASDIETGFKRFFDTVAERHKSLARELRRLQA